MVEGSGFENRRTGNGTRGSNPFSSAEFTGDFASPGAERFRRHPAPFTSHSHSYPRRLLNTCTASRMSVSVVWAYLCVTER